MNKVIEMGRLVADPESKFTPNNIQVVTFRLAVNRKEKTQDGQTSADFFDVQAWRQTAEFISKYFHKGQQVLIEGHLRNEQWTDKEGQKRNRTLIVAEQVYFAEGRRDDSGANTQPRHAPPTGGQAPVATQPVAGDGFYTLNEDDEDLPF